MGERKLEMTISIKYKGQLGNQMFQYAALQSLASLKNYEVSLPVELNKPNLDDQSYNISFSAFNMFSSKDIKIQPSPNSIYGIHEFHYNHNKFTRCPDNITLDGHFQTAKYFKNIEDTIRNDFSFKPSLLQDMTNFIKKLVNPIFIHIRRVDYVKYANYHPPCSLDYYSNALQHFSKDCNIIVVSDDVPWCIEQNLFKEDRFIFPNLSSVEDLCLMTLCSGGIIANSTFSWWGAFLGPNNKIIAPVNWFGPAIRKKMNTNDLYCSNWLII